MQDEKDTKTVILLKRPFGNVVYCLTNKYGTIRKFDNESQLQEKWKEMLFKDVSTVRQELDEKIIIAWFDARMDAVNMKTLSENKILLARLESPFFDIYGYEITNSLAKKLWGNSKPLVYDNSSLV